MKELKTDLMIKALSGALMSIIICVVFMMLSTESDTVSVGWMELIRQITGAALMGAIAVGGSVVYEIEGWGLMKATLVHYSLSLSSFLTASYLLDWFYTKILLITLIVYTLVYALIWFMEYYQWKKEISRMNSDLFILIKTEQEAK